MFWLLFLMLTLAVTHVNSKYASPCLTPNQQPGLCIPVKSCKPIYDFLKQVEDSKRTISDEEKSKLAAFHCETFNNVTHVCCPENEIQLNVEGLNILKRNTCGVYSENKILNGPDTAPFQFPWVALLKYKDYNFKCGGTLISDQYVLTAANCIKGKEHLLKQVRLGEYQISTEIDCTNSAPKHCAPPVEDIDIEEMIIHESFQNIYNDIALIKLKRKVEFKDHIKPICLPIYEHLRSKDYKNYKITGWGITEESQSFDILKSALLTKVNRTECQNKWLKYNLHYPLNDGHICADGMNVMDSCKSDFGGPLGYVDLYDKRSRFIQFGISSIHLYRCGVDNVPGIYTNVAHYIQWITDNLKETIVKTSNQVVSCTTPTLKNGFCVLYNECPFAKELLKNYSSYDEIPKYYINNLIKARCSNDNEPIRLCCEFPNEIGRTYTSTTENSLVTPSKAYLKLDENSKHKRQYNSTPKSEHESCITPTLEDGFCVPYKECLFVNELIQTFGNTEAVPNYYKNLIRQSKCSQDNEPIRLCCKMFSSTRSNTQTTAMPKDKLSGIDPTTMPRDTLSDIDPTLTEDLDYNKDFNSQFNQKGLNILNALSCGNSGGDRVAGGNETDLAEYPWMALLRSDTPGHEFICGGSLITNRYVLTATHCVNKVVYPIISVRLGEHNITTNPDCRQKGKKYVCNPVVEDFGVEKIIPHPRYNGKKRINDIALIKLDRNVVFKKHISPVCLPITKQSFEIKSTFFTIAGWGVTEISTKSSVLLKAEILAYSHSVCQNVFSNLIKLNDKHICAGDLQKRRDTCRGDSGGPLVAFNTYATVKHFIQYGIIAHGGEACNLRQGFPGIYTNVLTYLPWITNNIID